MLIFKTHLTTKVVLDNDGYLKLYPGLDDKPRTAALELAIFARESQLFARSQAPLFSSSGMALYDYRRTVIALLGLGLQVFARGGDAIIPNTSKAILAMLGDEEGAGNSFLPSGRRFFFERSPAFPFPSMEVSEAAQ